MYDLLFLLQVRVRVDVMVMNRCLMCFFFVRRHTAVNSTISTEFLMAIAFFSKYAKSVLVEFVLEKGSMMISKIKFRLTLIIKRCM